MDKRFQVFISSTFKDLQEERQAVLRAVLELGQMPAGMELFPAADDAAWDLIKGVIDASDFYVVIIGGRYGSLDEEGIGFTEKEYEYALVSKKPVIALLHENPDNLPREKTETDEAIWKKLQSFREKIEKRHTRVCWRSAEELKVKVVLGLTAAMKKNPKGGWVRADEVPTGATITEILSLRNRVTELEAAAIQAAITPPPGTDNLASGDELFEAHFDYSLYPEGYGYSDDDDFLTYSRETVLVSWDDLFAAVSPTMINEASDGDLKASLRIFLVARAKDSVALHPDKKRKGGDQKDFTIAAEDVETCIVQFRALGLIRESVRTRSVKDTETYWKLTPYGDHRMTQLRAIRRLTPTSS